MAETPSESLEPVTPESMPVPGLPENWHMLATDKIVSAVDQVKVKTSGPAVRVSRTVVFGLLAALMAVMAVIVLIIGLVRLLDLVMAVWLIYLVLGAIFVAGGAFLWSKRPRGAAS